MFSKSMNSATSFRGSTVRGLPGDDRSSRPAGIRSGARHMGTIIGLLRTPPAGCNTVPTSCRSGGAEIPSAASDSLSCDQRSPYVHAERLRRSRAIIPPRRDSLRNVFFHGNRSATGWGFFLPNLVRTLAERAPDLALERQRLATPFIETQVGDHAVGPGGRVEGRRVQVSDEREHAVERTLDERAHGGELEGQAAGLDPRHEGADVLADRRLAGAQ